MQDAQPVEALEELPAQVKVSISFTQEAQLAEALEVFSAQVKVFTSETLALCGRCSWWRHPRSSLRG